MGADHNHRKVTLLLKIVYNTYFVSVAVVVAFFICWAPFHAQRLVALYLATAPKEAQESSTAVYMALMHASGILYFLSTTINPILYHIFSNKFRRAFKVRDLAFWSCCVQKLVEVIVDNILLVGIQMIWHLNFYC